MFGFAVLLFILFAGAIAILRPSSYTSYAEVAVDPVGRAADAEAVLVRARAWLRSTDAARGSARSIGPAAANRFAAASATGPSFIDSWRYDADASGTARRTDARLVHDLRAHLTVERVSESYALRIGFTHRDPKLAALAANAFADGLVATSHGAGRVEATIRVISPADGDVPENGPPAWLLLAGGATAGVLAGALAAFIAERRFTGLTSGADLPARFGLYHLGNVPLLRSVLPDAASPIEAVVDAPLSGFAEAFRSVLVAMRQASRKTARVFLVTSALPDEGKSSTVTCLARSAALAGEAVVVVDCDSRKGGASAALAGDRRKPGLCDVLRGICTLDDALVQDARSGAWIIPIADEDADMSPLLGGEALVGLFNTLRTRFSLVLVDSAPILTMAATRSVLPLVDASVLVVRWRATPEQAVKAALANAPAGYAAWSGIILTQVDVRRQARYGGSDASAFYQQSSKYYS